METFSFSYFICIVMLFLVSELVYSNRAFSFMQTRCHDHEKSALLQFKQTFVIDMGASDDPSSYPKLSSWNYSSDECCLWVGVDCNEDTGNVVGLDLSSSCLFGSINSTSTLFHLAHLQSLNLADNNFNKSTIPTRLAHLSHLTYLNLSYSRFSGEVPIEISQLSKLSSLDLADNIDSAGRRLLRLKGFNFGSLIHNLTSIQKLILSNVDIASVVPPSIGNLTKLTSLDLSWSNLHGPIPMLLSQLKNLESLYLRENMLSGIVKFDMFSIMKSLSNLSLSDNNLLVDTRTRSNTSTFPQFEFLGLLSCQLTEFPDFLRNQSKLSKLGLASNSIQGLIPRWIFNASSETLYLINLSENFLTGYDQSPAILPSRIEVLFLNSNKFKGSLHFPPPSINVYDVSDNQLTGEVSPSICNLSSLQILAVSDNNLGGKLPPCLGNFSSSLSMLKLSGSNFRGTIPDTWTNGCSMRVMDLSHNQFQGHFPRSLSNCKMLEVLVIKNNQIEDSFPYWLGTLPELNALFMCFNRFHGAITDPQSKTPFPKLHIIDLSYNNFSGHLPCGYFHQWNAMKVFANTHELSYLNGVFQGENWALSFFYGMRITNKGIVIGYSKVQDFFKFMDLSNNRFEGEISELIGNLKGLNSLNISNNVLTGPIPSSLGNLSDLEVLDLSHNKLSGDIPQQLTQLNFLGSFNVAHNNLTGAIPHGQQFDTFPNSSFEGNIGLCGSPLSKKCGNSQENSPPDPSTVEEKEESALELEWKAVVIGCGWGIVIGIVVGHFVIERRHDWFVETFGIRKRK